MFTIEKNIPIAKARGRTYIGQIYDEIIATLDMMESGDSFIAFPPVEEGKDPNLFRNSISACLKNRGAKQFVVARVEQGFRIWKT